MRYPTCNLKPETDNMATEDNDGRTVLLKGIRLSFTNSLKDKQKTSDDPDAKPKHGTNIILETSSPHFEANKAACINAMKAAGQKEWKNPDAFMSIMDDNPKRVCFKKGERFKNKEGVIYAGYEGNWAMSASGPSAGQKRPILKDRQKRDVTEGEILDVFYSGCYADAYVSFFGTDKGSRGIFASVDLIRSHQTGERMAGGFVLTEDKLNALDDLDDDLPAPDAGGGDSDFG